MPALSWETQREETQRQRQQDVNGLVEGETEQSSELSDAPQKGPVMDLTGHRFPESSQQGSARWKRKVTCTEAAASQEGPRSERKAHTCRKMEFAMAGADIGEGHKIRTWGELPIGRSPRSCQGAKEGFLAVQ